MILQKQQLEEQMERQRVKEEKQKKRKANQRSMNKSNQLGGDEDDGPIESQISVAESPDSKPQDASEPYIDENRKS